MVSVQEAAQERATVERANDGQVTAMASTLARAFHDDPAFTWVLRDDPRRLGILQRGFELFLRRVWMQHDATFTTAHVAAVAVWEPPNTWKVPIRDQLRLLPAAAGAFGRHLPRVLRALTVLEAKHPRAPHYYLAFVGVDPDWQGRGLGSSVMSPIIERCDADGMAAFLEASTSRNRALYERHGFVVTEEFKLGRSAPQQWRMWREPVRGPLQAPAAGERTAS